MVNQLQIKILLRRSKPPIWRRILIRDDMTFWELHLIIQAAMGWKDVHLFAFDLGHQQIGRVFGDGFDMMADASNLSIRPYLNKGIKIIYVYDFGNHWEHLITVEKVAPINKNKKYPTCIKGKRNCPPEDCGGISGYYGMLDAIQDESHPEHDEIVDWMGDDFNPEKFDITQINKRLGHYRSTV